MSGGNRNCCSRSPDKKLKLTYIFSTPIPPATTPPFAQQPRTCQAEFTTAALVAALEQAWAAIRDRHPEVPAAVVVLGSGSPSKASQSLKWGHFDRQRWQAGTDQLPEVLVSG